MNWKEFRRSVIKSKLKFNAHANRKNEKLNSLTLIQTNDKPVKLTNKWICTFSEIKLLENKPCQMTHFRNKTAGELSFTLVAAAKQRMTHTNTNTNTNKIINNSRFIVFTQVQSLCMRYALWLTTLSMLHQTQIEMSHIIMSAKWAFEIDKYAVYYSSVLFEVSVLESIWFIKFEKSIQNNLLVGLMLGFPFFE